MSGKRKNGDDDVTGREKKKLKMAAARSIAVQPSTSRNAVAGSSSGMATSGLPNTINVERFVEARSYEIEAMHAAMKSAPASATHRVWQVLPRHLRRRAASHDVRRVPLRFRDRAKEEMDPVKKKLTKKTSKLGKEKRVKRNDAFRKRQVDKTWLETHIWHAKRMHMENLWGYRLAVSPTEKCYRPSHRASIHGSILHDASYYSMVEMKGPEDILIRILDSCCDAQKPSPGAKRYLSGARFSETHIYKVNAYPFGLAAPITVIWRPLESSRAMQNLSKDSRATIPAQGSTQPAIQQASSDLSESVVRHLWLRFHPSVHTEVMEILKEATSAALQKLKEESPSSREAIVDVVDLRGQFNVFEIMGPKASNVVKGVLTPSSSEQREEFRKFWASLSELDSSGSLPKGMVIGCKVDDPRLRFPPHNAQSAKPDKGKAPISTPPITFPTATLATTNLWDKSTLSVPRFKKKDIDARRSQSQIPGTKLSPLRQDDRVPVMVTQKTVQCQTGSETQSIHGWTLFLPAGWGMPFLESLVYTGTRVAGQQERQTQAYEAGMVYFPRDYPSIDAYQTYADDREASERTNWEKKPPGKRINYEALNNTSPWKSDWGVVLGIRKDDVGQGVVTTQRGAGGAGGSARAEPCDVTPWLLRGDKVPDILSELSCVFDHGTALHSEMTRLRLKRNLSATSTTSMMVMDVASSGQLLRGALVNVSLDMCSRGVPDDLAMVYMAPDELVRKWERFLVTLKRGKMKTSVGDEGDSPEELELATTSSSSSTLIGYVTTGHMSLLRGKGFAIGAIALTKFLELKQQQTRLHPNIQTHAATPPRPLVVLVRNQNSNLFRSAYLQVMNESC